MWASIGTVLRSLVRSNQIQEILFEIHCNWIDLLLIDFLYSH